MAVCVMIDWIKLECLFPTNDVAYSYTDICWKILV